MFYSGMVSKSLLIIGCAGLFCTAGSDLLHGTATNGNANALMLLASQYEVDSKTLSDALLGGDIQDPPQGEENGEEEGEPLDQMNGVEVVESHSRVKLNRTKQYTQKELEWWGKQLSSDNPEDRDGASASLWKAGKQAVEVLSKVASSDRDEVSNQAFEVLKDLYKDPDEATKTAAKKVLDKLAQGNNPRLSQRAVDAIKRAEKEKEEEAEFDEIEMDDEMFDEMLKGEGVLRVRRFGKLWESMCECGFRALEADLQIEERELDTAP